MLLDGRRLSLGATRATILGALRRETQCSVANWREAWGVHEALLQPADGAPRRLYSLGDNVVSRRHTSKIWSYAT